MDLSMTSRNSEVVSVFFTNVVEQCEHAKEESTNIELSTPSIAHAFLVIMDELNHQLNYFQAPPPITCVYNSTEYARGTFEAYVRRYCNTQKQIMFFGMNPGPWGMSQTGVPFGEVSAVREWLGIEGPVGKPPRELHARPVRGFACSRSEISGKRFWGLFKDLCGEPNNFFSSSFVYNYLPQQWMKENGCNVTPADFKTSEMQALYDVCDPVLCRVLQLYGVQTVVAVGKFCEARATKALRRYLPHTNIKVVYLPHPSPRTVNNNNWNEKAMEHLRSHNLLSLYSCHTEPLDLTNT